MPSWFPMLTGRAVAGDRGEEQDASRAIPVTVWRVIRMALSGCERWG